MAVALSNRSNPLTLTLFWSSLVSYTMSGKKIGNLAVSQINYTDVGKPWSFSSDWTMQKSMQNEASQRHSILLWGLKVSILSNRSSAVEQWCNKIMNYLLQTTFIVYISTFCFEQQVKESKHFCALPSRGHQGTLFCVLWFHFNRGLLFYMEKDCEVVLGQHNVVNIEVTRWHPTKSIFVSLLPHPGAFTEKTWPNSVGDTLWVGLTTISSEKNWWTMRKYENSNVLQTRWKKKV